MSSERHRWLSARISEVFDLPNDTTAAFVKQERVFNELSSFFRGETVNRMFVLYQPEANENISEHRREDNEVCMCLHDFLLSCHSFFVFFCRIGKQADQKCFLFPMEQTC